MKVKELLSILHDLPIEALDKDILMDVGGEELVQLMVEPIIESCDDPTVISYVVCEDNGQLSFDFSKDVN